MKAPTPPAAGSRPQDRGAPARRYWHAVPFQSQRQSKGPVSEWNGASGVVAETQNSHRAAITPTTSAAWIRPGVAWASLPPAKGWVSPAWSRSIRPQWAQSGRALVGQ